MVGELQPKLIANRYEIQNVLGQGGMGVVYRALDRLTQDVVALKMVIGEDANNPHTSDDTITPQSSDEPKTNETIAHHSADSLQRKSPFIGLDDSQMQTTPGALRLSFSREFQTLARLRHPHIISVLDYGFTDTKLPFFTMQLLEKSNTLTQAAQTRPFSDRITLVVQVLQALAYLHQVGIIHRDLKPDNALVDANGNVRLLDFGLATLRDQITDLSDDTLAGTIAYMAPELLQGGQPSTASDLYAAGIMAYEIFASKYPYAFDNISNLVYAIITQQPAFDDLDISEDLRDIIQNLLEKETSERAFDAYAVLEDMNRAANTNVVLEDTTIRESYLQAAPFVGREVELSQLFQGMKRNREGTGSAWLIGGAVGVGKTRLMEELRIRGLVNGFTVLRGFSTEDNDMPYRLWREPLKRLILSVDVDASEANILRTLMPDVETILQRNIPDAMQQEFTAFADQLTSIVLRLFNRLQRPTLLLLDDLQDDQVSLDILNTLTTIVKQHPLMIVASYRTDRLPDMPSKLPSMKPLTLPRLSDNDIESLSVSMIGESARRDDVQRLLKREAEGNIYFLIEVIRALAEEAGRLRLIGDVDLPAKIQTTGLQAVLARRLNLIEGADLQLLQTMAVDGRDLDLPLLRHLAATNDLDAENWLATVSNISIIERQDEIWRFAHERLRTQVIETQPATRIRDAHLSIATSIEEIYPDAPERAAGLAHHWREAGTGNEEKELAALRIAGDYALRLNTFVEAVRHFARALELMPNTESVDRAQVQIKYANALQYTGDYDAAHTHVSSAIKIFKANTDVENSETERAEAINLLATIEWQQSNFDAAEEHARESFLLARDIDSKRTVVRSLARLGMLANERGNYDEARTYYDEGLAIAKAINDEVGQATINNNYGILAYVNGEYDKARSFFESSLAICEARSEQNRANAILNNLGSVAGIQGDTEAADAYMNQSLASARQIGDRRSAAFALENLGFTAQKRGEYMQAKAYAEEGLEIARSIGNQQSIANTLVKLAAAHHGLGDETEAITLLRQSLHVARSIQAMPSILNVLAHMADYAEDATEALSWVGTIQAYENVSEQTLQITSEVVSKWAQEIDPDVLQQHVESGRKISLMDAVDKIFADYTPSSTDTDPTHESES